MLQFRVLREPSDEGLTISAERVGKGRMQVGAYIMNRAHHPADRGGATVAWRVERAGLERERIFARKILKRFTGLVQATHFVRDRRPVCEITVSVGPTATTLVSVPA